MLLSVLRAGWRGAHYLALLAFLTLTFDISKSCGLDFSFWLVSWYIATIALRGVFRSSGPMKAVITSATVAEPLVVVGLLLLAIFRSTKGLSGSHGIWETVIRGSDPILTLLEGFGTILIIQKSSQVVRRLAGKSDGYQIGFLVLSASVYVIAGFGLYQLYAASAPELVPSVRSASVIGCCMTLTIVLSIIALVSGRGVITDTAFLFAYMVMSMYIAARNEAIENLPAKSKIMPMHSAVDFGPLSVPYLQSLSLQDVEKFTIQALVHLSQLVQVLVRALSPNILISLLYRMGVLMAVSHIAPSLNIGQESSNGHGYARKSSRDYSLDDGDESSSRVMPFLASMAKPVLLMTHTRILLQYFGYARPALAIWGWLNSFLCLALFAAELVLARDDAWEHYRND
ncbi:MAG: ICE2-domain-containing protein [Linnemannia elongata]|nr:MAG: ICE2-domain-containing protein [Linnemannia elongata]